MTWLISCMRDEPYKYRKWHGVSWWISDLIKALAACWMINGDVERDVDIMYCFAGRHTSIGYTIKSIYHTNVIGELVHHKLKNVVSYLFKYSYKYMTIVIANIYLPDTYSFTVTAEEIKILDETFPWQFVSLKFVDNYFFIWGDF